MTLFNCVLKFCLGRYFTPNVFWGDHNNLFESETPLPTWQCHRPKQWQRQKWLKIKEFSNVIAYKNSTIIQYTAIPRLNNSLTSSSTKASISRASWHLLQQQIKSFKKSNLSWKQSFSHWRQRVTREDNDPHRTKNHQFRVPSPFYNTRWCTEECWPHPLDIRIWVVQRGMPIASCHRFHAHDPLSALETMLTTVL